MERRLDADEVVDPPRKSESDPGRLNEASSILIDPEDSKCERALIRKIDLHVLPFVVLLYLFSFLDRGSSILHAEPTRRMDADIANVVNIGNARLYGMEEDLGLVRDQYQIAVSILFVTYCVCPNLDCLGIFLQLIVFSAL